MLIQCENCNGKYRITIKKNPGKTVSFKCAKCGHAIKIKPEDIKIGPAGEGGEAKSRPETIRFSCVKCGNTFLKQATDPNEVCNQCRIDSLVNDIKHKYGGPASKVPPPESKPPPPEPAPEPEEPRYTIRSADGLVLGPIRMKTVKVLVREKRIRGLEEVSKDDSEYQPLMKYPELAPFFPDLQEMMDTSGLEDKVEEAFMAAFSNEEETTGFMAPGEQTMENQVMETPEPEPAAPAVEEAAPAEDSIEIPLAEPEAEPEPEPAVEEAAPADDSIEIPLEEPEAEPEPEPAVEEAAPADDSIEIPLAEPEAEPEPEPAVEEAAPADDSIEIPLEEPEEESEPKPAVEEAAPADDSIEIPLPEPEAEPEPEPAEPAIEESAPADDSIEIPLAEPEAESEPLVVEESFDLDEPAGDDDAIMSMDDVKDVHDRPDPAPTEPARAEPDEDDIVELDTPPPPPPTAEPEDVGTEFEVDDESSDEPGDEVSPGPEAEIVEEPEEIIEDVEEVVAEEADEIIEDLTPVREPPPDARYRIRYPDGLILGPIKLGTIKELFASGNLTGQEEVQREDEPWAGFAELPELIDLLAEAESETVEVMGGEDMIELTEPVKE